MTIYEQRGGKSSPLDDPATLRVVREQICKGYSEADTAHFIEVCRATGLNPLLRLIYPIQRQGKMTYHVSVDGLRLMAARTGAHAGTDEVEYGPEVAGYPSWARCTVYRIVHGIRCPFTATVRWTEQVQTDREGRPLGMWAKMPYNMMAKAVESLALRKAFPQDLASPEPTEADQEAVDHEAQAFAEQVREMMYHVGDLFDESKVEATADAALRVPPAKREAYLQKIRTRIDELIQAQATK
jgi:phage recombination protein Bet